MLRGDFARAWEISDAVLRARGGAPCWHLPRHEQYLWDGQSLAGRRVLVRCYHGLGDTVQFIRYMPLMRAVARDVTVWAQPLLLPLLGTVSGIDRLLPLHDGVPDGEYDGDIELMELPHYFRTMLETLPATVPYIRVPEPNEIGLADAGRDRRAPPARGRIGRSRPASGGIGRVQRPGPASDASDDRVREIGIVWQSGDWDDRRSIPTALLEPVAQVPGVRLYALQQGAPLREWPAGWGAVAATPDPSELARRMSALDLVISVDSFPAHLAGALGVPTWTLLHAAPDWRWMLGRDDTPWYPTMRLWRQDTAGDWATVIQRVAQALRSGA